MSWRPVVPALVLQLVALSAPAALAAPEGGSSVPVSTAQVRRGSTEIVLTGLGTAQAWQSVTARAQVNGYLSAIEFQEGQAVHKSDLLAMIDPRPYAATLAQAAAHKASDQANLANDRVNLHRDTDLAQRGFGSQQQADNDEALVREYEANVQADDAAIASARLNLDFCQIRAPIDGVVGFRLVDVGNLIEASAETAIVTVQQIQPIAVVFTLPEQEFEQIESAIQLHPLVVRAYTADDRTLLDTGTLVAPDNSIATASGTIALKAVFPNAGRRLWPGQYVQSRLVLRTEANTIAVADDAVQHGPDGLYVYTVDQAMVAHHAAVTVGYDDGKFSVVRSGLAAGETIVTGGQERVQDGSKVESNQKPALRG